MARTYDVWLDDLNGVEYMKVEVNVDIPEGSPPYEGNLQCIAKVHDVRASTVKMKFFNNEVDPKNHILVRLANIRHANRTLHGFIYQQTGAHDLDRNMFSEFQKALELMFDYHEREERA